MKSQKSAEIIVGSAHGAEGSNMMGRSGTGDSYMERGADQMPEMASRVKKVGGGTAEDIRVAHQAVSASEDTITELAPIAMEEIVRNGNINLAWQKVRRNKGSAGVDGLSIDDSENYLRAHWSRISQELLSGTYKPQPVRRVDIPKPNGGGTRMLGIPTVTDRLIQQAILQILVPHYDPTFSDASFGYRPGRSAGDAVQRARDHITSGKRWVVDMDLEKFLITCITIFYYRDSPDKSQIDVC